MEGLIPNINFGVRVGGTFQGKVPSQLNGFQLDTVYVEPRFSGTVNKWIKWRAAFNACADNTAVCPYAGVHVLDLIAQFGFHDAFNVWLGHLLVPGDRSNFSGPFFIGAWNYPGFYGGNYLVGPNTGPFGRDTGGVVWGQFLGGKLKYYLGAFGLEGVTTTPKIASRINIDIVGEEPGYFHSSTYYGEKDILSVGGGLEYQKDGELGVAPAAGVPAPVLGNLVIGMVDVLAEKKFAGAGVGTLEGAYYHYDSSYSIKQAYFALASWMFPWQLGIGKLELLGRWQQAFGQTSMTPNQSVLDAFLHYVIAQYDARLAVGYQRQDRGVGAAWNAIQFGIQVQK